MGRSFASRMVNGKRLYRPERNVVSVMKILTAVLSSFVEMNVINHKLINCNKFSWLVGS